MSSGVDKIFPETGRYAHGPLACACRRQEEAILPRISEKRFLSNLRPLGKNEVAPKDKTELFSGPGI